VGIGKLIGFPSMMGDGAPPAALSKPLRLKTSLISGSQHKYRSVRER
jgi:hypothetical protein